MWPWVHSQHYALRQKQWEAAQEQARERGTIECPTCSGSGKVMRPPFVVNPQWSELEAALREANHESFVRGYDDWLPST